MANPTVSIIIPTRNGERDIEKCLTGIFAQDNVPLYEVIVIDSGSSDDTLNIVRKFPVNLTEIKPHEFGHGKTRNLGASLANGKYLVYLTQDAVPANKHWLQKLVRNLHDDEKVAGVYSRWLPKADCNPIEARWVREHFGPVKEVRSLSDLDESDYVRYIEPLIFFSDVSSCLRKAVWESIPFDKTLNFGEDRQWAKTALQAGHTIVYEPHSIVYHSHSESLKRRFIRAFDAGVSAKCITNASPSLLLILPLSLQEAAKDWLFMRKSRLHGKTRWFMCSLVTHATDGAAGWLGTHHRYVPIRAKIRS